MPYITIIVQLLLGILLFFIINWIGKHSYSIGYMEISLFVKAEEAPAFNYAMRVVTPIVYILIVSAIFYYLKLDVYTLNIYMVNVYYIIYRLLFNIFTGRGRLLNWYRQFIYWLSIILFSYYIYEKIIKIKGNILPDFNAVANELWIIIIIFLFHVTNNVRFAQDGTIKRKEKYLTYRYNALKKKYGVLIKELTQNEKIEIIVYAIIIYEEFNRPKLIRTFENVSFYLTKRPHTLGIMQVRTAKMINDLESIKCGIEKINNTYYKCLEVEKTNPSRGQ